VYTLTESSYPSTVTDFAEGAFRASLLKFGRNKAKVVLINMPSEQGSLMPRKSGMFEFYEEENWHR